jgi:hypothetical protein
MCFSFEGSKMISGRSENVWQGDRIDMGEIIETREADIVANAPKNDALYLRQVDELRAQYPGKVRFRIYEDVLTQFAPDLHRFVEAVVNRPRRLVSAASRVDSNPNLALKNRHSIFIVLSTDEARRIAKRVDDFTAIRSVVRTHMYLLFQGDYQALLTRLRELVSAFECKGWHIT